MKKLTIMTLGISILFALSCFLPLVTGFSSESEESFSLKSGSQVSRDIIIVDDEGDGDYTSIKDALSYADPGDTIEVYSGIYYEHDILINKEEIVLKGIPYELGCGNDTGKPFIYGQGLNDVINIKAKNISIIGFHIENSDGTGSYGIIWLWKGADNCLISDNDLSHSVMCLIGCGSDHNRIVNNTIGHSSIRQGIVVGGENNTISGNIISDVETGILFWNSHYNTITGNKISRCSEFGLDIAGSDYNTVEGNTFEDNTVGVQIYHSLGSRINYNNFIDNQWQAQFEYGFPLFFGLTNRWNGNYWDRPRLLPYPIIGTYIFFPWVQFDWRPVLEPYDIPSGETTGGNQEKQTSRSSQIRSRNTMHTGSIKVTVKHALLKVPIEEACVVAYNIETKDWDYILPDENNIGVHINNNLPVGEYFLGAGKEGYTIDGTTITIKENQQITHTFYLRPESPDDYSNKEQGAISEETIVNQQNSNSQSSSQQSMSPLFLQIIGRLLNLR